VPGSSPAAALAATQIVTRNVNPSILMMTSRIVEAIVNSSD